MVMYILILLSYFSASSRAVDLQPILSQISTGNSECNKNNLLHDFDLKTVPQFNALCNIPVPDIQQSEFLLENNVVPVLCMGLMDVTMRLCKSAKDDVSPFEDIFPPTAIKFNKIFVGLSKSNDFSSLDEFCSTTVKKFSIKEAASNSTELWWQVLNKQLGDEKHCSDICHSNEENRVHPLCSYILWSNGVFINYQKNKVNEQVVTSVGEEQNPPVVQKVEETAVQGEKTNEESGFVKDELPARPTVTATGSLTGEKHQIAEANKSNFTTENNNVGEGTVEQVINNVQPVVTASVKTNTNTAAEIKKPDVSNISEDKKHKVKETVTTLDPSRRGKVGSSNVIQEKPGLSGDQLGAKVVSTAAVSSSLPEPQGNAGVRPPIGQEGGEGLVEGDVSIEVTPDPVNLDPPITAEKDFQPPYTDEEGEDGDGDDIDIVEPNPNTASNNSSPLASKASNVASIHSSSMDGDKVYGDGEILMEDHFIEAEDSHFFTYFLCMAVLTIMAYLAFHNKKKLIALAVEGRRTKGGRRRPNSSHYSKLDCSLEEALVSNTTASVTHVLY